MLGGVDRQFAVIVTSYSSLFMYPNPMAPICTLVSPSGTASRLKASSRAGKISSLLHFDANTEIVRVASFMAETHQGRSARRAGLLRVLDQRALAGICGLDVVQPVLLAFGDLCGCHGIAPRVVDIRSFADLASGQ